MLLVVYVPVGTVCGLIGGVLYGLKQRPLTAASLCAGVLGGGIVAMSVYGVDPNGSTISPDLIICLQFAGAFLGILYTKASWQRGS
jgi:20S proteasome alpha/beta subunit